MKKIVLASAVLLTFRCDARADLISERWAGGDTAGHPNSMTVEVSGSQVQMAFDLTALPAGAQIYDASLYCFTQGNVQPVEPVVIVPHDGGESLRLEGPWYRSFDATEAVREARGGRLVLLVESFEGLEAEKTHLDIRYEGRQSGRPAEQVTGVRAIHHNGQTFVIWKELAAFRPATDSVFRVEKFSARFEQNQTANEPGTGFMEYDRLPAITLETLRQMQGLASKSIGRGVRIYRVRNVPEIRYRIYRHKQKITTENLKDAKLIGETGSFCGFDEKMRRISYRGEFLQQQEIAESIIPTLCYQDGTPLSPGEGLYVHTPEHPGRAYYAVTAVLKGTENTIVGPSNGIASAIEEETAPLRPVFQRVQTGLYDGDPLQYWFLFWPARELSNIPRGPDHVIVTVPKGYAEGDPMEIGPLGHGGTFNLVDHSTKHAPKDALKLHMIAPNNLCYSNGLDTLKSFRQSKVDYFSERYLLSLIRWCQLRWRPQARDLKGNMLHFGIRHPEIFAYLSFGTYTTSYDYQWAPQSRALQRWLGPRQMAMTVDGLPAWEQFNISWYVNRYPGRDVPYLYLVSGTGKDKGHTSEFGWQDDPRGWSGLREARQNFTAFWARSRTEVYTHVPKMTWGKSVPAFSNCSLDNNPGNGDPADGDPFGQINGWLLWQVDDIVDEPGRWEMTVYVTPDCPVASCTVGLTPRRAKRFRPEPGEIFEWTNTGVADGKEIRSGTVTADRWGLVTLKQITVTKEKNRIEITR